MGTSGINFSGVGSGIDTESIIDQLMKLHERPITALQARQSELKRQQIAVSQVSGLISALQAAAGTLDATSGFSLVSGTSSDPSAATITTAAGAQPGTHALKVLELAQTHRIGSTPQSSQTDPLGVSGQILVNGKAVSIGASDTLQTIAASINAANAGVAASVVSTSATANVLVLSSTRSGAASAVRVSDVGAGTLASGTLGLVGGAAVIADPVANGAASALFADSATSIGTLLGLRSPQAGTFQIDGVDVSVDFGTDSLSMIAARISAAGIAGVTASVAAVKDPVSGIGKMQLTITGASTPTFTDSQNLLANLGVVGQNPTNELVTARDASFELDGLAITRDSNTVTDVLAGATLNLLKDSGTPTTQLTVSADLETIQSNVGRFVDAYNQLASAVGNLSVFDPQTLSTGPLFGDVTIQNTLNVATDILTGAIPGLTGSTSLLSQIGIKLDETGQLRVDDAALAAALSKDTGAVARIFQASGVTTDSGVSYISSTDKTQPGGSGGYAVAVTRLATRASLTAGMAHTADDNPDVEVLNFEGEQFGASGHTIVLRANSTIDDIASQINADAGLAKYVTATVAGGSLTLTATDYGSAYSFSVRSTQPAAANNSGIGNTEVQAQGLDVAGTINGEVATGKGQYLTGASGNATTDGLQLRITSTTTGSLGTVSYTRGVARQTRDFAQTATDYVAGTLTKYSNDIGEQVSAIDDDIAAMRERLASEKTRLRRLFAAMDSAVANIKAAGSGLSGLMPASAFSSNQ